MLMPEFIRHNLEPILCDWDAFAATLRPAAQGLTPTELRDFADEVLRAVAADMERRMAPAGSDIAEHAPQVTDSARRHAADRFSEGFTLTQLVAEFRALRVSVADRWVRHVDRIGAAELEQLMRFDQALDASLAESIGWYSDRLDEARDLFVGAFAHDLRSPLGAIAASAQALLLTEPAASRCAESARLVERSSTRMGHMISQLLDFTRTRLGAQLPISSAPADLRQILHVVVGELEAVHGGGRVALDLRGNLEGRWDARRLEQMLSNLIANALQYGREASPVTVAASGDGDEIRIAVHNDGEPIPQYVLHSIFNPLVRGERQARESPDPTGGMGLGLYIARHIAEAHGGRISVRSSSDDGTSFHVTLPRAHDPRARSKGMA